MNWGSIADGFVSGLLVELVLMAIMAFRYKEAIKGIKSLTGGALSATANKTLDNRANGVLQAFVLFFVVMLIYFVASFLIVLFTAVLLDPVFSTYNDFAKHNGYPIASNGIVSSWFGFIPFFSRSGWAAVAIIMPVLTFTITQQATDEIDSNNNEYRPIGNSIILSFGIILLIWFFMNFGFPSFAIDPNISFAPLPTVAVPIVIPTIDRPPTLPPISGSPIPIQFSPGTYGASVETNRPTAYLLGASAMQTMSVVIDSNQPGSRYMLRVITPNNQPLAPVLFSNNQYRLPTDGDYVVEVYPDGLVMVAFEIR